MSCCRDELAGESRVKNIANGRQMGKPFSPVEAIKTKAWLLGCGQRGKGTSENKKIGDSDRNIVVCNSRLRYRRSSNLNLINQRLVILAQRSKRNVRRSVRAIADLDQRLANAYFDTHRSNRYERHLLRSFQRRSIWLYHWREHQ